jgi:hypothetical protein
MSDVAPGCVETGVMIDERRCPGGVGIAMRSGPSKLSSPRRRPGPKFDVGVVDGYPAWRAVVRNRAKSPSNALARADNLAPTQNA